MSSTKKKKERKPKVAVEHLPSVETAVQNYRVIEDGAYAYHLQNEEIENHYANNINQRKIVMEDIKQAKVLQDEEDKIAKIWTIDQQEEIEYLDSHLAVAIQEELTEKEKLEAEEAKQREIRDRELSLLLFEQERRRAARHGPLDEEQDRKLAERLQNLTLKRQTKKEEDRMREFTDEELASRLQVEEQLENDRTSNYQTAQEKQDAEYAKYIHQKDLEKAEALYGSRKSAKGKKKSKHHHSPDEPAYFDDNFRDGPPPYSQHKNDKPARPPPPSNGRVARRYSEPDSDNTEVKVPFHEEDAIRPTPASRVNGHNNSNSISQDRRRGNEQTRNYSDRRHATEEPSRPRRPHERANTDKAHNRATHAHSRHHHPHDELEMRKERIHSERIAHDEESLRREPPRDSDLLRRNDLPHEQLRSNGGGSYKESKARPKSRHTSERDKKELKKGKSSECKQQ